MRNHLIRPSLLLCLLPLPHILPQRRSMRKMRRRRRREKTPVLLSPRTPPLPLLFLSLAPSGRYASLWTLLSSFCCECDWMAFIWAFQRAEMLNIYINSINHYSLFSSCCVSIPPVSSLPSTFAYWRIPVLWLSTPVSSVPPHRLSLRAAAVALLHPRALRVLPALMLLNITTQNAPLLTWPPVISLLLVCQLRISIIPLTGRCSRWISCQFFFFSLLAQKMCLHLIIDVLRHHFHPHLLFAQRLCAREFSQRSIKERAVLLSSMLPGSNKPLSPLPESQVVYCINHNAWLMSSLRNCCMFIVTACTYSMCGSESFRLICNSFLPKMNNSTYWNLAS